MPKFLSLKTQGWKLDYLSRHREDNKNDGIFLDYLKTCLTESSQGHYNLLGKISMDISKGALLSQSL